MKHLLWALILTEAFSAHGSMPAFQENLVDADLTYPFGVSAADLDGDGKVDIVAPDVWSDDHFETEAGRQVSALYWYRNLGGAHYKKEIIFWGNPGFLE